MEETPLATRRSAQAATGLLAGAALLFMWSRRARPTEWRDRVAVVTGGARGLGFALARELSEAGAIVWMVSRTPDQLARAVRRLRARGGEAHAFEADVTRPDEVEALVAAVMARHGRLDVIVNNAGVITAMPFENATVADFEESIATHFWGPLYLTRAALPWLRQARPGHVINISSVGGRVGVPHLAPYCAGKFALTGLSQVLSAELAASDVHVTLATPGLMRTGSVRHVRVRGHHQAEARWFAAMSASSLTSTNATAAARGDPRGRPSRPRGGDARVAGSGPDRGDRRRPRSDRHGNGGGHRTPVTRAGQRSESGTRRGQPRSGLGAGAGLGCHGCRLQPTVRLPCNRPPG